MHPGGCVRQITSNLFMKREFGSKFIEGMPVGADTLNLSAKRRNV
jgi:hypothetical protein